MADSELEPPAGARIEASNTPLNFDKLSLDQQSPLPKVTSNGIISTDITAQFRAAAATLQPGELVKDGYFTLFESVGALELMDPKMDSGCHPESDEPVYDSGRPLLTTELLGIMDQLWCLEMAWHLGYPPSQTLFASIYLTDLLVPAPNGLADADFVRGRHHEILVKQPTHLILRAYCIALTKMCYRVMQCASLGLYYEDEDIGMHTHNVALLEDVNDYEVHQVLEEARAVALDLDTSDCPGWTEGAQAAVLARLDFREAFYTALELAEVRVQPDALEEPWRRMKAAVEAIQKTHTLGKPVEEAFNTKMQSILASSMPPRPIVQIAFDEACKRWAQLADDGSEAVGILSYADPKSLLTFVATFMGKTPQPLVCIRTLVQGLVFADNVMLGTLSIRQVMDNDLAITVMPCSVLLDPHNDEVEAVHDPRFALAQKMEDFRQRAFPSYLQVFRTLCQNRSRARRLMVHVLQDWDRLQLETEDMDQAVAADLCKLAVTVPLAAAQSSLALPLSSWAFLYKLQLMEWVVQLGFELQIYQSDELAGMYWYLSYLAKRRVQHADRIRTYTLQGMEGLRQAGGGGSSSRVRLEADQEAALAQSLLFLQATLLDASVTWEMADALASLYAALQRCGVEDESNCGGLLAVAAPRGRPYGTDELRYETRMRPFVSIGVPPLPSFATFESESKQADASVFAVLEHAERALTGAKKGCEVLVRLQAAEVFAMNCHARWLAQVMNTQRSAILAGLSVAVLKREVERMDKEGSTNKPAAWSLSVEVPKPDKCYHAWWVVPKISEQK